MSESRICGFRCNILLYYNLNRVFLCFACKNPIKKYRIRRPRSQKSDFNDENTRNERFCSLWFYLNFTTIMDIKCASSDTQTHTHTQNIWKKRERVGWKRREIRNVFTNTTNFDSFSGNLWTEKSLFILLICCCQRLAAHLAEWGRKSGVDFQFREPLHWRAIFISRFNHFFFSNVYSMIVHDLYESNRLAH